MYQTFSQNMKKLFIRAQDIALFRQKEVFSFDEIAWALAHYHLEETLGNGATDKFVVREAVATEAHDLEAFIDEGEKRPDALFPHAAEELEHVIETVELRLPEEETNVVTLQQFIEYAWSYLQGPLAEIFELKNEKAGQTDVRRELSRSRVEVVEAKKQLKESEELAGEGEKERKSVAEEITDPPQNDGPIIGREREVEISRSVLRKQFRSIPFFHGASGSGLTSLLGHLSQELKEDLREKLGREPVFKWLEYNKLSDGSELFASLDTNRLKELEKWLVENPNVVLIIDEVEIDDAFFEWLGGFYARYTDRYILWSIKQDFSNLNDSSLDILFSYYHPVEIEEPEEKDNIKILKSKFALYYGETDVTIDPSVFSSITVLSETITDFHKNPKRSIKLLDHLIGFAKLRGLKKIDSSLINLYNEVMWGKDNTEGSKRFSLPDNFEESLKQRVFGQDSAVSRVVNVMRLAKFQLDNRPERPDGVFLFTGPSGVGKTELARAVNDILYARQEKFFRLDMSEFAQEHMVHELIGSPPGYMGSDETPALLGFLQAHRQGVLLLDEFEKAHPKVHRLFMNVFDSGRLTSAKGTVYRLGGMTIMATMNVLSEEATRPALGFAPAPSVTSSSPAVGAGGSVPWQELKQVFPVELLNRFDEIISFDPLDKEHLRVILKNKTIVQTREKLKERFNLELELDQGVIDYIVELGYSEELGYRSIQRMFQRKVLMPMLKHIESARDKGGKVSVRLQDNSVKVILN